MKIDFNKKFMQEIYNRYLSSTKLYASRTDSTTQERAIVTYSELR